jgi:integrase/recombinase XerD
MAAAITREQYLSADEIKRLWTVTEADAITDAAKGRVTGVVRWAVVDVALQTGLRGCELAKLTHGDIDYRRATIRVHRAKRAEAKTELIAMPDDLAAHLRSYTEWKETAGKPTERDAALFIGERGPMTVRGLQQAWKRAVSKAGLDESLSLHAARHSLAVSLLSKTGNLRLVQKQLGHSSPTTTANFYADVSHEDMKAGLEAIYANE